MYLAPSLTSALNLRTSDLLAVTWWTPAPGTRLIQPLYQPHPNFHPGHPSACDQSIMTGQSIHNPLAKFGQSGLSPAEFLLQARTGTGAACTLQHLSKPRRLHSSLRRCETKAEGLNHVSRSYRPTVTAPAAGWDSLFPMHDICSKYIYFKSPKEDSSPLRGKKKV